MPEIVSAGDFTQAQQAWLGIIGDGKRPRPLGNGGGMDEQTDDILLRLDGSLADIRGINAADRQVTTGCGITIAGLEDEIARAGLCFPALVHDPAKVTLGGWIGVGMPGCSGRIPASRRLLAATVLTPQGRLIHSGAATAKDVAGYDFHRPLVGTFGRLGMLLEVTLAVDARPVHTRILRLSSSNPLALFNMIDRCLTVERVFVHHGNENRLPMMIELCGDPAAIELDQQNVNMIVPDCEVLEGDVAQLWHKSLTEAFATDGFYLHQALPVARCYTELATGNWWGNPWEGMVWRYVGMDKPSDTLPANQMLFERSTGRLFPHPVTYPKWAVSYSSTV